jgi:hypothetical protein
MEAMNVAERRARLVRRHHLAADAPAADVLEAATDVLVLHATDPATVYLSALARCPTATVDDVGVALYEERSCVRMLAMRRTLFVVPAGLVAVVHSAASREVARKQRARLIKDLQTRPTDPPLTGDITAWLADVENSTERALIGRGEVTANELASDEPRLRTAELPTTDKAYDVRRNITTRVLTVMACEGRIVRNRPRGSWTSRHHTWVAARTWWPDGITEMSEDDARVELARRWLRVFGPAPRSDLQWWSGWTLGATRKALAGVDTTDVDLDGVDGIALSDDLEPEPALPPSASLLPALDPTPMGWQQRAWFLGPHKEQLFDRNGNIGPSIWWDGRIVGGWAVRPDGDIAWQLLEDIGSEAAGAVEAEAAVLQKRLEDAVVVPTFRTPLERELSAGPSGAREA